MQVSLRGGSMAQKKKEFLKEAFDKVWPQAKKELDKGVKNAKKMLAKSEKYLKELSEKGVAQTKKVSLSIKREKAYYDLGKAISAVPSTKWKDSRKISSLVKEIKGLGKDISKIK